MAKSKPKPMLPTRGGKGRHMLLIIATPMGGKPPSEPKKAKGSKGRKK